MVDDYETDLHCGEVSKKALLQRLGNLISTRQKTLEQERQRSIDEEFRRETLMRSLAETSIPEDIRQANIRRYYLSIALDYFSKSNCLDKQLVSILIGRHGEFLSIGWNACNPNGTGYEEKVVWCLRKDSPRGADRALCKGLHAEVMSCLRTREEGIKSGDHERFGWHQFETPEQSKITRKALRHAFSRSAKKRLRGAKLFLFGAHYVCNMPCEWLLHFLKVEIPAITVLIDGHRVVHPAVEDGRS